ncbi:MAG TPA: Crp/Fnr family transcriptional regulator [Candidatus Acidoferrales bacterium]|nr:Crp/Fnr family transcriptional regulator [Candidatus Acidoferrales bacterium]
MVIGRQADLPADEYNLGMLATASDKFSTLKKAPLFAELDRDELTYIAERAAVRRFDAGQVIFSEGDACPGLWVIEKGRVRISKSSPGGREQVLAVEGPGSSVAELPVFDGGNYPASAASVDEATLLFVSKGDFQSLCLKHPQVALKVLRIVGRRLRGLVAMIEELSFSTVRHRLIALLVRMARQGEQTSQGIVVTLPANNQELAARIGTVRELVSRNISRLQAEGLIHLEARKVIIPDLKALQKKLKDCA